MELSNARELLFTRFRDVIFDPLIEALASFSDHARAEVMTGDSLTARKLRDLQGTIDQLASDSFAFGDEDGVLATIYLLPFSRPELLGRIVSKTESAFQYLALDEYFALRFPEFRANPLALLNNRVLPNSVEERLRKWREKLRIIRESRPTVPHGLGRSSAFKFSGAPSTIPTVLVHGTFAATETWWRERPSDPQNFWAYIKQYCGGLYGSGNEFSWSGGNSNSDREQAARDFLTWWQNRSAPKPLQVIAHSHGCNVIYLAVAMEPTLHIENLVSLGGPVRTWYPPFIAAGSRISRLHNVYSRYDFIQLLGAIGGRRGEGRSVGDSERSTNLHIPWMDPKVHTYAVGHGDLHEAIVWHGNGLAASLLQ